MNDIKLFQITEEDKAHYKKIIKDIDINHKDLILKVLEEKIQIMFNDGIANKVEIELIESMIKLVHILNTHVDLPIQIIQEILFAMSYFIDENDEITDITLEFGYLDDIMVANWILDDVQKNLPEKITT